MRCPDGPVVPASLLSSGDRVTPQTDMKEAPMKPKIVNETTLDPSLLRALLEYDCQTGKFKWKSRPESMFEGGPKGPGALAKRFDKMFAGQPAFTKTNTKGYLYGWIFGRGFMAHRVAWAIYHGTWPKGQIDHINHDRKANWIGNLRDVSQSENQRNRRLPSKHSTGTLGVYIHKPTGRFQASIGLGGDLYYIGLFDTIAEASAARRAAEKKHNFHENHGRNVAPSNEG